MAVRRTGSGLPLRAPRSVAALQPAATGWMAHEQPFAFSGGPIRLCDRRLPLSERDTELPALYSARSGLRIINEIGVAVDSREIAAADRATDRARRRAWTAINTCRDPRRRGGVVTFDVSNGPRNRPPSSAAANILVDFAPRRASVSHRTSTPRTKNWNRTVAEIRESRGVSPLTKSVGRLMKDNRMLLWDHSLFS